MRRYAIALLTKLTLTHPYGIIHGGDLNVDEWQERYREVAAELTSLEQRPVDEGAPVEEEEDEREEGDEEEDDDTSVNAHDGDETAGEDQMDEDELVEQMLDVEGVPTLPRAEATRLSQLKAVVRNLPKLKGRPKPQRPLERSRRSPESLNS